SYFSSFHDPPSTDIYTLSLHDALPIYRIFIYCEFQLVWTSVGVKYIFRVYACTVRPVVLVCAVAVAVVTEAPALAVTYRICITVHLSYRIFIYCEFQLVWTSVGVKYILCMYTCTVRSVVLVCAVAVAVVTEGPAFAVRCRISIVVHLGYRIFIYCEFQLVWTSVGVKYIFRVYACTVRPVVLVCAVAVAVVTEGPALAVTYRI